MLLRIRLEKRDDGSRRDRDEKDAAAEVGSGLAKTGKLDWLNRSKLQFFVMDGSQDFNSIWRW